MARFDFILNPIAKATAHYLTNQLQKGDLASPLGAVGVPIKRSSFDGAVEDRTQRAKPHSGVSFETLRKFSVNYEVARICINARKRQISSLEWDIVPADPEDKTDYSENVKLIKAYFKNLGGYRVRFREFQDTFIEDLLVLDGACLYKQRTVGGAVEYYMPVDAATIKLRVDESGNTPQPPEIAYRQYIRGVETGAYTADEMIYEMMNPRSDTPYGLAPLESLIMVVTSALKANMFNLDFLTSGNIPEGLLSLPPEWSPKQIEEFMNYFDALVSGNTSETSKMKPIPGGSTFTETKKRSDMAFKEFNDWLMRITCAMFDVQPQEIGFTDTVNKANGSEQNDITTRRGILPLANLLTEVFNDIIQEDLGFPQLRFQYMGLEDRDMLQDAQAKEVRLRSGITTIDEVRKEEGLDPLGIDIPYIPSTAQFVTPELLNPPKADATATTTKTETKTEPEAASDAPAVKSLTQDDELRRLEKYATRRIKLGKAYRPFESDILDETIVEELNSKLAKTTETSMVKTIVGSYLGRGTPRFLVKSGPTDESDQENQDDYEHNPALDILIALTGFNKFANDFRDAIKSQAEWTANQLADIERRLVDLDMDGLENLQRSQVISYLSANMPPIADKISTEQVVSWYTDVANSSVNALYDSLGSNVVFDLKDAQVLQQLADRAENLLTKSTLDETTKKRLAKLIVDDKAQGMTIAQIKADIISQFDDISKVRAGMIAHTETVNLMNQMQYDSMKRVGVLRKSWVNYGPNPCPVCMSNAGETPIPMDAYFDSGDLMPAAHTGCECGLDYEIADISVDDFWSGGDEEEI